MLVLVDQKPDPVATRIFRKVWNDFSSEYKTPMPYSMYFSGGQIRSLLVDVLQRCWIQRCLARLREHPRQIDRHQAVASGPDWHLYRVYNNPTGLPRRALVQATSSRCPLRPSTVSVGLVPLGRSDESSPSKVAHRRIQSSSTLPVRRHRRVGVGRFTQVHASWRMPSGQVHSPSSSQRPTRWT